MKGENNSLKKKVHSLQIDLEKLSRKVSTTQARSSGLASVDENYGDGYNIAIGSSNDNNQANSVNIGGAQPAASTTDDDIHNQSVRSDFL